MKKYPTHKTETVHEDLPSAGLLSECLESVEKFIKEYGADATYSLYDYGEITIKYSRPLTQKELDQQKARAEKAAATRKATATKKAERERALYERLKKKYDGNK